MVAADRLGSAWLVAVIVTVCCVAILAGAVYRPAALSVPAPIGLIDQVTPGVQPPITEAENCCVCPPRSVVLDGETVTATGGNTGALDGFRRIPAPPWKSTVRAMIAVFAVLLEPLLKAREVVGKYSAPVRRIDAPPPKLLESAGLLIARS